MTSSSRAHKSALTCRKELKPGTADGRAFPRSPRGLAGTDVPPLSRRSAMWRRAYGNSRQSRWAYPPEPWILSAPLSAAGIAHPCARPLRRAPRGPARRALADGRSAASQIRRAAGTRAQVDGMTGDRTPNHSSAPRLEPSHLGETQLRREANRAVVGGLGAERHRLVRKRIGEPVERRRARLGGIPASPCRWQNSQARPPCRPDGHDSDDAPRRAS